MNNKGMTKKEKALFIMATVGSIIVVLLVGAQVTGLWSGAVMLYLPVMAATLLCHALLNWDKMRSVAVFCLCVSVFLFLLCALAFIPF